MLESPVVILYDSSGNALAVQNGVAIPASTSALLLAGSDGTNARYLLVDGAGRPVIAGAGIAGTPAGGVASMQGVAGGTPLPVSAATLPLPTGAATEATLATRLADATFTGRINTQGQKAMAASTPVVIASDQSPVPVSGTVTAANASVGANNAAAPGSSTQLGLSDGVNLQASRGFDLDTGAGTEFDLGVSLRLPGAGGSVAGGTAANPLRSDPTGTTTQPVSAVSLPLPTGAATETTLAARLADATFTGRINTQGQKTMVGSTPVVLASDQSAVPISAAALPLPTGASTEATLATRLADATFTGRINTQGQKAMAASTPVVIASDQAAVPVTTPVASTSTRTSVASSAATVQLLAANASRKGGMIVNDSNKKLFLMYGTDGTTTDFSVPMDPGAYHSIEAGYVGRIAGIWSTANGAARITELT